MIVNILTKIENPKTNIVVIFTYSKTDRKINFRREMHKRFQKILKKNGKFPRFVCVHWNEQRHISATFFENSMN